MTEPPRRARIGVVSCYFPLFDAQMPPGFRQEREAVARSFAELLARDFDVVDAGMLASDEDGDRANATLREARLDAVVVAPTMAAPPSYTVHALAAIDAPVVVWNPITIDRLPDGLTQSQATVNSSQVAAVMLANPLVRAGRPFATVTASPADEAGMSTLTRTVRAAAAASTLRGASVLRVGNWIPGYLDVESTGAELARLGVTEHAVTAPELNDAFAAVAADRVGPELAAITGRGLDAPPRRGRRAEHASGAGARRPRRGDDRRRRHRQLPLRRAPLEPRDRDHGLPRRLAPHRRRDPGLLHGRPADGARARDRTRACRAARSTASSTPRSARRA